METDGGGLDIDDFYVKDGESWIPLLSSEGEPNPDLASQGEKALAAVASAICLNGRYLDRASCERVAGWAKELKLKNVPLSRSDEWDFVKVREAIKESPEQVDLQRRAARSCLRGLLLCLLGAPIICWIGFNYFEAGGAQRWIGLAVALIGCILLFWRGELLVIRAAAIWKEQEQKNLLAAVRHAETVYELNLAGLFAHLPKSNIGAKNFDAKIAGQEALKERERLADALYRNPSGWLD